MGLLAPLTGVVMGEQKHQQHHYYLMASSMTCQGLLGGTLFATILTHEALLFVVSHMSGKC